MDRDATAEALAGTFDGVDDPLEQAADDDLEEPRVVGHAGQGRRALASGRRDHGIVTSTLHATSGTSDPAALLVDEKAPALGEPQRTG